MKKLFVLATLLLVFSIAGLKHYQHIHANDPVNLNHPATFQAKTTHMLGIMKKPDADATDDPMGICTGTAIGPHAILTAEHCNRGKSLQLDYSLKTYKITKVLKDGRDHVIYLVDGPEFHNVEHYETRTPVIGEKVFTYGFGGRKYPGQYKTGVVLDEFDPSEVDQADGLTYYSLPGIPGDSGSAVYGMDGRILGVLTYGIEAESSYGRSINHMAAFTLNFTPEQITEAQTFVYVAPKETHVVAKLKPRPALHLRNPFTN